MTEFISATGWKSSALKNHWWNLKNGKQVQAILYDKNLFALDIATFARTSDGMLIAHVGNKNIPYVQFKNFLQETGYHVRMRSRKTRSYADYDKIDSNSPNQRELSDYIKLITRKTGLGDAEKKVVGSDTEQIPIKKIDSTHTPEQLDEETLISELVEIMKQRMSTKKKTIKSDLAKQAIPIIGKLWQAGLSYKQITEELQTQGVNVGRNVLIGIWNRYGEKRKGVITRRRIHALRKRHITRHNYLVPMKSYEAPTSIRHRSKTVLSAKERDIKSREYFKRLKTQLKKHLDAISTKDLLSFIDQLERKPISNIKASHAKILYKNTDKSAVNIEDIDNATLIDITILEPYSYKEEERVQLAKLLYELLQGNLDKHKKALELKKQLMEQYGLSAGDFVQIRVKIVIKGRQIFHETTFKI